MKMVRAPRPRIWSRDLQLPHTYNTPINKDASLLLTTTTHIQQVNPFNLQVTSPPYISH
ncbi:hypothetical protein BDN67DRAFT_645179 [Paxillus ammoniavirescens]|nr:hypothetical protein BDN67DRAFT_645179 [Paxillus ammoniavirescens]